MNTESEIKKRRCEISIGVAPVRIVNGRKEILLIHLGRGGYELPKGHPEGDEWMKETALREFREETACVSEVKITEFLDTVHYEYPEDDIIIHKTNHYFLLLPLEEYRFGDLPEVTRERRWITALESETVNLIGENIRPVIKKAFKMFNPE